jgi:SAM-dependent methyltransferase
VTQTYDRIGEGYTYSRQTDPRIASMIARALGDAMSIVNVGAGAGSYEPADRFVVAVEPSQTMIRQRRVGSAPVVQASATNLPFGDRAFSATLAVLTVHHWPDCERGLAELARVARDGAVVLTWDPDSPGFWLVQDYFPELLEIDRSIFPSMDAFRTALGPIKVVSVPIPHDCHDGFLGAYWRKPHAYLDARARGGISTFAQVSALDTGLDRLRGDLEDGRWARRHGDLMARSEIDIGYRLVISGALRNASCERRSARSQL